MTVRAVIDTNVWISALINPHGYPAIKGNAGYFVTRDDDVKMDIKVIEFLSQSDISVLSIAKFLSLIGKN